MNGSGKRLVISLIYLWTESIHALSKKKQEKRITIIFLERAKRKWRNNIQNVKESVEYKVETINDQPKIVQWMNENESERERTSINPKL